MKSIKLLILFFLIFLGQNISAQTQNYVGHVTLLKRTSSMVYLGAGTTTPNSESKDLGFGNMDFIIRLCTIGKRNSVGLVLPRNWQKLKNWNQRIIA